MRFPAKGFLCLVATCVTFAAAFPPGCSSQTAPAGAAIAASALTADQIVEQMRVRNLARNDALRGYQSVRHYEVEYKGYSAHLDGRLTVQANYDAVSGKSFTVLSQSGSKMLVEKVLKRLVQSEMEAGQDHRSTELIPANYKFRLLGTETIADRPAFVLAVEPVTGNKFLYRGKIWIDAEDFALARIEAEPARNPSFWISSTAIHQEYSPTDGFWLPVQNRSKSVVRIGGAATLTIDYGNYQLVPAAAAVAGGGS
jgi:hypothetical protein